MDPRKKPCLSRVPHRPKGSGLRLRLRHIPPVVVQTLPPPIHPVVEDMAPGRRAWGSPPGGCGPEAPLERVGVSSLAAELTLPPSCLCLCL